MPLKILIVTPAPPGSRHGNRQTAARWARLLRAAGHVVDVVTAVDQAPARRRHDLMIALHARRSHASMTAWKSRPDRPLVLVLTGTDLYRDLADSTQARESLRLADCIVVLQPEGLKELDAEAQRKARVIYQSAQALARQQPPVRYTLITVIGHLREEKDPFRAAHALRHLPPASRVRVVHLGTAMSEAMAVEARALMAGDPRYRWLGELPHGDTMRWLARSHAMVISSRMEGGAHVVSEAIAIGVPVLASAIAGNLGLLGSTYPGYFPLGDEAALAHLISRLETDRRYALTLERAVAARRHLTDVGAERDALEQLVADAVRALTL